MFGDPHIITFDGLGFDCQAAGEFVMSTSIENPSFQIQEQFTRINSTSMCSQTSVSTGIAIADEGMPTVQISTPRTGGSSLNTVNSCPIDLYINGVAVSFLDYPDNHTGTPNMTIAWHDNSFFLGNRNIVNIWIKNSATFGCYLMTEVVVFNAYRPDDTILGLLGTCNLDS